MYVLINIYLKATTFENKLNFLSLYDKKYYNTSILINVTVK
jgi:hypothetical protein